MSIYVGFQTVKYSSETFRNTLQIDIPNKTCSVVGIMSARVGISTNLNLNYTWTIGSSQETEPIYFGDNIIIQSGRVFISAHGYDYWTGLIPGRSGTASTERDGGTIYMFNLEGEDSITFNRNLFLPNSSDNSASRDWNATVGNYETVGSYADARYLYTDRKSILYQTDARFDDGNNESHFTHSIYDGGGAVAGSTLREVGHYQYSSFARTCQTFSDRYMYLSSRYSSNNYLGMVSAYYNRGVVGFQTYIGDDYYYSTIQEEEPIFNLDYENILSKSHTTIIDKFYVGYKERFGTSTDYSNHEYVYRAIAAGCGRLAVGAPNNSFHTDNPSYYEDTGSVSVYTLDTLRHIATLEPPSYGIHDRQYFGGSIAIGAGIILVGASQFEKQASWLDYDDPVYVYDLNGQFIKYIDNPAWTDGGGTEYQFGRKMVIKNNLIYISAIDNLEETNYSKRDLVYIYDAKTFDLLEKIYHPWVDWSLAVGPTYANVNKQDFPFQNFGCEMVAEGSKLIIGANASPTSRYGNHNSIEADDPTAGSAVLYKMHENYDTYYQSIIENYRY